MDNPQQSFNETFEVLVAKVRDGDPSDPATLNAAKVLKMFSESHVPTTSTPTAPAPTTRWGKVRTAVAKALDNETTRTTIKAAASIGGVITVTWATIHRDHVLERNALAQANQRPLN